MPLDLPDSINSASEPSHNRIWVQAPMFHTCIYFVLALAYLALGELF
jgi:hypothetical protein